MYFLALATDYDETIAEHGQIDRETLGALEAFKETGRRLILVTGRELDDLKRTLPEIGLFDRVVAENGALLYDPATEKTQLLAAAPPAIFVERLMELDIRPLSIGKSIVATWEPNETIVLDVIRELGLELQIVFNKGAVMVLPAGMNKAEGLKAALAELCLSPHNVVGVGDAQNDHAFLKACGCSAAVDNALPMVKERADIVLAGRAAAGVRELLERIRREDGGLVPAERHGLAIGTGGDGKEIHLEPFRGSVLIAGSSGIGKSTLATALTERMAEKHFEFCVFDPEGDYAELEDAVTVGTAKDAPNVEEALSLVRKLGANVVVDTQALAVKDRPSFFAGLIPQLSALRAETGRPHWLIVDEAHHLLPADRDDLAQVVPDDIPAAVFVTVHPESVSTSALKTVERVIALGKSAARTIAEFCKAVGIETPAAMPTPDDSQILFWCPKGDTPPALVTATRPRQARRRHSRKYAEGELPEDSSFYFRGPEGKLRLRAQNLALFKQIADGVDDATWDHHLRAGEYSAWFREIIKDDELAEETAEIEADATLAAPESRKKVADAITRRYTASARQSES